MEKTILTTVFSILLGTVAFSQSTRFLKRVENNYSSDLVRLNGKPDGYFNLDSKTEVEKLFFGDINAGIEFYVSPSTEANYGFRILKKPSDGSYTLEVKRISNWKEVETELREEFPWQRASANRYISEDSSVRLAQHNQAMLAEREKERPKRYQVETESIPVTDSFAEKLHERFVSSIDHFKGTGRPGKVLDGEETTFRCVVGDDVWTLTVSKTERNILELSDLCKRIIEDAEAGRFDESKYIGRLEDYGQEDCN